MEKVFNGQKKCLTLEQYRFIIIYRKKVLTLKNTLILDTETTLDIKSPLVYDLGFIGVVNGKVEKFNFLIKEVFDTKPLMDTAYYKEKRPKYWALRKTKRIEVVSFQKAFKFMIDYIRKNKIETISAYNIAFDIRAINNTLRLLDNNTFEKGVWNKLLEQKNKKVLCIWDLSCNNLLNTQEYKLFADTHKFKSEKGNYLTNAEVAYAYIKNEPKFKEKHMALSDSEIELEILKKIMEMPNPKIDYGKKYGSWRKVQK